MPQIVLDKSKVDNLNGCVLAWDECAVSFIYDGYLSLSLCGSWVWITQYIMENMGTASLMEHSFYVRVPIPVNLISNQECKIAFEQDKLRKNTQIH